MNSREEIYRERIKTAEEQLINLKKKINVYSILRLLIFISAVGSSYLAYKYTSSVYMLLLIILHSVLFLYVAKYHEILINKKESLDKVVIINSRHIMRVNGQWKKFEDTGEEYLDSTHGFINDLDLFGSNSLFQWINVTETPFGRESLKDILRIESLPTKEEIILKQKALKELGGKIDFRENLSKETMGTKERTEEIYEFVKWARERSDDVLSLPTNIVRWAFPIINLIFIASVVFNIINWQFLILLGTLSHFTLKRLGTETIKVLNLFKTIKYDLSSYFKAIEVIENQEFESKFINDIKKEVASDDEKSSSMVKNLSKYASWIYDRSNAFYLVLNIIFLWDYQVLYKLELWRRENGNKVERWFNTVGKIESLCSLSLLSYNNENWCIPSIEEGLVIRGEDVSHPMLLEKAVANSFNLGNGKGIMLITGSNMSGKSTFLRTLGFNLVLTYLGVPVRAKEFTTSIFNIYTCMRTGDNLEESISSFYAEILRVKNIVDASKRGEKIFFLLDEIFKGTNSLDRHTGAKMLIGQLSSKVSMGLVSTHDLELCDLEGENSKVVNYNFREYYDNNKLKFDYKLRRGRSETRNAIYLMKMAGIDVK